jgi:transposase-like protein
MEKHRTKPTLVDPVFALPTLPPGGQLALPEVVLNARLALRELFVAAGCDVLSKLLEVDRTALCGPKGKFQEERVAYRHGHDEGVLVLGGRKVRVPKPRARRVDGKELELPHWRHFSQEDPLDERVQEQILLGVSTRDYRHSLERLPAPLPETGISRSNVSRRFVARTTRAVEAFLSRPLGDLDVPVVLLDGVTMGEHVLLTALGIDATGRKQVLGVVEGSSCGFRKL